MLALLVKPPPPLRQEELLAKKSALHADLFAHTSLMEPDDDEAIRAGKPEPDIYLLAAQRLQVDARECTAWPASSPRCERARFAWRRLPAAARLISSAGI